MSKWDQLRASWPNGQVNYPCLKVVIDWANDLAKAQTVSINLASVNGWPPLVFEPSGFSMEFVECMIAACRDFQFFLS